MLPYNRLLLKVTGSIAAYKSCELISLLKAQNPDLEIKVVLSKNAHRFVGPEALEALTGHKVHQDIFESGSLMDHIYLARWAEATLVYPASANTISSLAHGRADSLIGALFLAYELGSKPYFVAPAMNTKMWEHPAQKNAVATLTSYGVKILPTESGTLACGEVGLGRLLSPENTISALSLPPTQAHMGFRSKPKNILISSGATREPIDGVRFLTNFSSGKTGATLADCFTDMGHNVTLLHGVGAALPENPRIKSIAYTDFVDLKHRLFSLIDNQNFAAIIQAAAISDYSVDSVEADSKIFSPETLKAGKLETKDQIQISLKRNEKLLPQLRSRCQSHHTKIVGFKLTKTESLKKRNDAVKKLVLESSLDLVVQNDLNEIEKGSHTFRIYNSKLEALQTCKSANCLAEHLSDSLFSEKNKTAYQLTKSQEVDL